MNEKNFQGHIGITIRERKKIWLKKMLIFIYNLEEKNFQGHYWYNHQQGKEEIQIEKKY